MKKIVFTLCFCAACLLYGSGTAHCQDSGSGPVNTLEDKVYGLSLLWSEIKYNFVNIDRLNFDLDSLYRQTMRRVIETKNDVEYYNELDAFLVALNDGHTQLLRRPVSGYENTDYPKYSTRLFGDRFYFTSYRINSPDTDPELLGAEIVEIEGLPAMEYAERYVMPTITSSTERFRMRLAGIYLLNGPEGTRIEGKARKPSGEIIGFDIIRDGEATRTPEDKHCMPAASRKERAEPIYCEWKGGVAVLTINRFWPDEMANSIDSAMNLIKSRNPSGLIIDLRRNGGGSTPVARRLLMHLTPADSILTFGSQTRTNLGYGRAQGNYREEYEDHYLYRSYETFPPEWTPRDRSVEPVECPVAVLIGPDSYSACEDFLVDIYEIPGRPVLIGEETGGSTGAPLVVYLPHGAVARICTLRILYPYSMKPFAGTGIVPDIEVIPRIEDYFEGRDPVMDKALDVVEANR